MKTIKQILIDRDGMSEAGADDLIRAAKEEMQMYIEEGDLESAYEICADWFGLEPDYLMELL